MSNNFISICIILPNQSNATLVLKYLNKAPEHKCTGVFLSGEDAMAQIPAISPNIVLLDIHLPGINGIECIKILKAVCKNTQFMMYTACDDETTVLAAIKAGAAAYILNSCTEKDLAGYITELHYGGSPISGSIARKLILWLQQPCINNQEKYSITKREKEILLLLEKGNSYNAVADLLFISNKTVRKHICNIYEKMDVGSKTEALNKFFGRN
jgi:DNA-binding NarL/FixJ family response regulator